MKRRESVSEDDLDSLFSNRVDGIEFSAFSPPVSIQTLQRINCSCVPAKAGVYVVMRAGHNKPDFLDKSEAGRFKSKAPSVGEEVLKKNWVDEAEIP